MPPAAHSIPTAKPKRRLNHTLTALISGTKAMASVRARITPKTKKKCQSVVINPKEIMPNAKRNPQATKVILTP